MKVEFYVRSVVDWSDVQRGVSLVNLLDDHGLHIAFADEVEPVKRTFTIDSLPLLWRGRGLGGYPLDCTFLFRGKESWRFSGSVFWSKDSWPGTEQFNAVYLHVDMRKELSGDHLVKLGDRLFQWADAAYGNISLDSRMDPLAYPPSRRKFLPGVFWVNYFGPEYIADPGFRPELPVTSVGAGVRIKLTDNINDCSLDDAELLKHAKMRIGKQWFADDSNPQAPLFDFSRLWQQGS